MPPALGQDGLRSNLVILCDLLQFQIDHQAECKHSVSKHWFSSPNRCSISSLHSYIETLNSRFSDCACIWKEKKKSLQRGKGERRLNSSKIMRAGPNLIWLVSLQEHSVLDT